MPTQLVSIIVPIYNTEQHLANCIKSIINQTYHNLEIILINDGSTDKSPTIAKRYASQDHRIQVFTQKNSGASAARNLGLSHATGDYISFIDSDDIIDPDFISKLLSAFTPSTALALTAIQYKRLKQSTSQAVYTNPPLPHRQHQSAKSYILSLLTCDGRLYSVANKLFRADIIRTHRLTFDESLDFAEDTKFVLSYLKHAKGNIVCILDPLYIYNYGTDSSTIQQSGIIWGNWQKSYNFLKTWVGRHPSLEERFWLFLIHCRWRISYRRAVKRATIQKTP